MKIYLIVVSFIFSTCFCYSQKNYNSCALPECDYGNLTEFKTTSARLSVYCCETLPNELYENPSLNSLDLAECFIGEIDFCKFSGKLKHVTFFSTSIHSLKGFHCLDSLQSVEFEPGGNRILYKPSKIIESLSSIDSLPKNLNHLGLMHSPKYYPLNKLSQFQDLKSLNIQSRELYAKISIKDIHSLQNINRLVLDNYVLDTQNALDLSAFKKLDFLSIWFCKTKKGFFENLKQIHSLKRLSLAIENVEEALIIIQSYPSIESLKLNGQLKSFPTILNNYPKLKEIEIPNLDFTEGIEKEIDFSKFEKITLRYNLTGLPLINGEYWPNTKCRIYYSEIRY